MNEKTIMLPPEPGGLGSDASYRLTVMIPKRRYLSYLRERWWVVLVCVALGVLGVVSFETLRQERYESYANLYLTVGPQLGMNIYAEPKDDFANQVELLKGAHLRQAALERLEPNAVNALNGTLDIDVVRPLGSSILQLKATSPDADISRKFLEALISEYQSFRTEARLSTAEDVVASLEKQLASREELLKADQKNLAEFEKTNDVALMQENYKSSGAALGEMKSRLQALLLHRELLLREPGAAEAGANPFPVTAPTNQVFATQPPAASNGPAAAGDTNGINGPAATVPGLGDVLTNGLVDATNDEAGYTSDTQLKDLRLELDSMETDRKALTLAHGGHWYTNQMVLLHHRIGYLENEQAAGHQIEVDQVNQEIAWVQDAIATNEATVRSSSDLITKAGLMHDAITREQNYYDNLSAMLRNVDLTKDVASERVTVLDAPSVGRPERRFLPLRICLAVVGALAMSMGAVFGWHMLDDRFVSVRDVKDQFGESVLGIVPQIKVPRRQARKALLAPHDPRPHYAESYRHLRSALLLSSMGEARPQTLLFTGATPGEGKTTIAVNLARVLARSGLRVALVDADPQHPTGIHELLGLKPSVGVVDFLRGEAAVADILQPTDEPSLTFVSSGINKQRAEGIFMRPELADLISSLRQNRDFVIVDGAPILGSDNSALLVPHMDAVVLVARPFYTKAQQMRQALEMLYQRQAKAVTIVFNRARADDLAGHYAANGVSRISSNGVG